MGVGHAASTSKTRALLLGAMALAASTLVGLGSLAGPIETLTPTPTPFQDHCSIDKWCSVGGSEPQKACTAEAGEEVTYTYQFSGGTALIIDDKLGVIGEWRGETLSRTTTLTETTTNTASFEPLEAVCITCDCFSSVTVTVTAAPPTPCAVAWPQVLIFTSAKGQSPANNAKLSHAISGHIIDPTALGATAHRIEVCADTRVTSAVTDTTGTPSNVAPGTLQCSASGCSGVVSRTEDYHSISADGQDRDRIRFIPR